MKIESKYLVDTEWLSKNMDDPNVLVVEANAKLPNYFKKSAENGVQTASGESEYLEGHIPGADFIDMYVEMSDQNNGSHHSLPLLSDENFCEVMSRHGIGHGVRVVIYDRSVGIWACRFWLMLKSYGFDEVAILDGGYSKWTAEGRTITSDLPVVRSRNFVPRKSRNLFSAKDQVVHAMNEDNIGLINALSPEEFAGHDIVRYGRPGHIPSSRNVHSRSLMNMETNEFQDREVIERIFGDVGVYDNESTICYCGGAVGAASGVFLLHVLGVENVSIYNGSLKEWAADLKLPLVTLSRVNN